MHPQEWVPCKDVQFSTLRITSSRVRQVCPAEQTRIALGDIMRHVGMSRKLLILHRFQSYCCWNPVWKPVEVGWLSHHLHGFMTIPGGFRHFSSKLSNLCQSYPKEKKGTDFGHQGSCRSETQWRIFFSSADVSKNHPLKISQKVRCLVFFFGMLTCFCGFPKWVCIFHQYLNLTNTRSPSSRSHYDLGRHATFLQTTNLKTWRFSEGIIFPWHSQQLTLLSETKQRY